MELSDRIASVLGKELSEEEQFQIDQWQNGQSLADMIQHPGWEVIVNMLKSYRDEALFRLAATDPGNIDEVRTNHAVFYSAERILNNFQQDVNRAIEASKTTPFIVKDGVKRFSSAPPESL